MANLSLMEVTSASLSSVAITDGQLIVVTDTGDVYRDIGKSRIEMSRDIIIVDELPIAPLSGKVYLLTSDKSLYWYNSGWTEISAYELPTATTSTLGGIKVGNYLSISSGKLSVNLSSLRTALRPTKVATISVTSSSSYTNRAMSVNMASYSEADIDLILVHGSAGVNVQVSGAAAAVLLDTTTWSDVLSSTDTVRLTFTLQCRDGIYIKNVVAAPVNADATVVPVLSSGYLDSTTNNNKTITIHVNANSGYLQSGTEGEIWAR